MGLLAKIRRHAAVAAGNQREARRHSFGTSSYSGVRIRGSAGPIEYWREFQMAGPLSGSR